MVEGRCVSENISVAQRAAGTVIVIITLLFAWYPFNFSPENDVAIVEKKGQAQFNMNVNRNRSDRRGIAYTTQTVEFENSAGITFHFKLTPLQQPSGLGCILTLFDGSKKSPFVVAQWQNHLALFNYNMSGAHKQYREVGLRDPLIPGKTMTLTISTTPKETVVFIDGKRIQRYSGFTLLDTNNKTTMGQIVIGNNIYGTEPWHGSIEKVTLYNQNDENSLNELLARQPLIDYKFETHTDEIISNRAGSAYNLLIPHHLKPLARSFLAPISVKEFSRRHSNEDIFLNVVGFMPISFCIAMLTRQFHQSPWKFFISTVSLIFLFSLTIETVQVFLPSRTSSQLDLLTNTFAGIIVALFFICWKRNSNLQMEK